MFAWKKSYEPPRQHIQKKRHHFTDKGTSSQSYGFSSSHVQMWELDHKESWVPKNWCSRSVVLKNTLESPLDSKEIKSVNPIRNQPWIFFGRTDAEDEVLWPSDVKSWLIGKDPDPGKDWREKAKRMTEGEMVGWHYWYNGRWHYWCNRHKLGQTPEDGKGQGSLAWFSSWAHEESNTTWWLNNSSSVLYVVCPFYIEDSSIPLFAFFLFMW